MLANDNRSGRLRISSPSAACLLKQAGIDPIMQPGCRNRNRIALLGDLPDAGVTAWRPATTLLAALVFTTWLGEAPLADELYDYYASGDPADVTTATRALVVMQGGGDDVDMNYVRMGEAAGGGDFVVLRASGDAAYNDYIYALCRCNSVETIVLKSREASSEAFVIDKIRNAEAIFLAGGDQSNYVRYWKGTAVEDAINHVSAKPAPIGGTSAGMAILGQFSYSAMSPESLTAEAALEDPYNDNLTIEADFLEIDGLQGIITDQHVLERDRIGRTVALLARLVHDGLAMPARAIAADRETAVHLDPVSGEITVHATGSHETPYAYFLRTTSQPEVCEPDRPLVIAGIEVVRVGPGGRFNVRNWHGNDGIRYTLSATDGKLDSSRDDVY